jgi:hypothetical protein
MSKTPALVLVPLVMVAMIQIAEQRTFQQTSESQTLPRSQAPDLGRPTRPADTVPLFDFEKYFLAGNATWTFEWDAPEGLLGAGGMATGSTVYRKLADGFFGAISKGKDAGGAFTVTETIAYAKDDHAISRSVTDSRGYSYLEIAHLDGSLGGTYGFSYESAPFAFNGKTYRLQHFIRLISTGHYRVDAKVAIAGARWTNYGIWWYQLDIPETRH